MRGIKQDVRDGATKGEIADSACNKVRDLKKTANMERGISSETARLCRRKINSVKTKQNTMRERERKHVFCSRVSWGVILDILTTS